MSRTGQNIGHVRADRPPSKHAMGVLRRLVSIGPAPSQEMNFTVRDKLLQHGFITIEPRPSPYRTHKPGTRVDYAIATDLGRDAVKGATR